MAARASVIELDRRTGRTTGAAFSEGLGLAVIAAAGRVLGPWKDFGLSHVAGLVARVLPSAKSVRIRFADGDGFEFPYGDRYWSTMVRRGRVYEEGIESVLAAVADVDFAFVDCGANYGYWSVRVSGGGFGAHPTVAIEAAPDTFAWLERNLAVNGGRFVAMNRAVGARSGDTVAIYGAKHEARTTVGEGGPRLAEVKTIALDDVLLIPEIASAGRIVVKLDVEGAEIAALQGGKRMLERDVLIAYEDHGSDRAHCVSRHLTHDLGMQLYAVEEGPVRRVTDLAELDAFMTNRRWGYDFFATRSPFWGERLDRIAATAKRSGGG